MINITKIINNLIITKVIIIINNNKIKLKINPTKILIID
jgi:hypothetical protein